MKSIMAKQVEIEQAVKEILASNGVTPLFNHYYMVLAKKIAKLTGQYGRTQAENEADIKIAEWQARGLDAGVLAQIKQYFMPPAIPAPPVQPFRLDISLLDGPDVLV